MYSLIESDINRAQKNSFFKSEEGTVRNKNRMHDFFFRVFFLNYFFLKYLIIFEIKWNSKFRIPTHEILDNFVKI